MIRRKELSLAPRLKNPTPHELSYSAESEAAACTPHIDFVALIPNSSLRQLAQLFGASIGSAGATTSEELHCSPVHAIAASIDALTNAHPAARALLASMASTMTTPTRALVVDSHLHVWSSTSAFAPGKEPPPTWEMRWPPPKPSPRPAKSRAWTAR